MARAAGVTPRWAIETLRTLEAEGVVHSEWTPPSWRWTLNPRHFLVQGMKSLADLDGAARGALRAHLQKVVRPLKPSGAIWFGSTARGDEEPGSDVDLLLVVRTAKERARAQQALAKSASPFYWTFGNRLSPIVLTQREFDSRRRGPGFVKEALEHGIWIWGRGHRA